VDAHRLLRFHEVLGSRRRATLAGVQRKASRRGPASRSRGRPPATLRWLFPELDVTQLEIEKDGSLLLARILERGRMIDVEWCLKVYGLTGIRAFFRAAPHPEISPRTAHFWRLVLHEEKVEWPSAPSFRRASAALWPR
jgi:hypothetical protein